MPKNNMKVEEFFDNFLTSEVNLNKICGGECTGSEPDCDICLITTRYKELVEDLKTKLKISPTEDEKNKPSYFLTGSYRRHTMIRPPKDVDLFIILDAGEYQDSELSDLITPKRLLNKLHDVLGDIFESKKVEVKIQQHSVCVYFDENFSIDVIPAFETDNKKLYKIADVEGEGNGKYIVSNPKVHYDYINEINESTSVDNKKRFKKVVRLLKYLKRETFKTPDVKIRSFHFELLAAKILGSQKINSYAEGINNFLSKAENYFDKASITDPVNSENNVDDYIEKFSEEIRNIIKAELHALGEISQKAIEYENSGQEESAIEEWKKIFAVNSDEDEGKGYYKAPTTFPTPSKPWANT